jgi:hypothetical protein
MKTCHFVFVVAAMFGTISSISAQSVEQKIKDNTSLAYRSHVEYQMALNKVQTAAFEQKAPEFHSFAAQNKLFAAVVGPPAPGAVASGEEVLRAKLSPRSKPLVQLFMTSLRWRKCSTESQTLH